jgi:glycosyltransferase involved in cell wall biosynthesis
VSTPIRVLELRSVRGTGGGPEKTILLGAARADARETAVTVCYLRDRADEVFGIDQRARQLNLDYVEIAEAGSLDWTVVPRLRRLVRERHIDIVHAHDYKTDLLALVLQRTESIIPLTTAHGWTGHSSMERRVYYPADKWLMRRFPQVVAVSSEIRDELLRWGCKPARVEVVLNGIDHRAFRRDPSRTADARAALGLADGAIAIGSVGRLEPQKRFDLLIEAFSRLRRSLRDRTLHLFIAGEGSSRPELQSLIDKLQLGHCCHLIGHQSDIRGLHHALDLFVQSSEYEGTPNVVLEAMALETPVVVTAAGGTGELVRNGEEGLLIPHGSVDQLHLAMEEALRNPAATDARRQTARDRVEHDLSFDTRMATVQRIYERLVAARPRTGSTRTAAPTGEFRVQS